MKAFISYSHHDEHYLERLKIHLTPMRRDGRITDWADKDIYAGSNLDSSISDELESSDLFIALISPDYLASNYCYEKEFNKALAMQEEGRITIVPIILQPCEWKNTPFVKMKALPKDGKEISEWTNENNAYLDIANELRRLLDLNLNENIEVETKRSSEEQVVRNYRVKLYFSEVDSFSFKEKSFEAIKNYFIDAVQEINDIENLQARLTNSEKDNFTCLISNRSNNKDSFICIALGSRARSHFGDLRYEFSQTLSPSSVQLGKTFNVENDDYDLYWTQNISMHYSSNSSQEARYTAPQVAEIIWDDFIQQVGVSIERD
jgi:hypothetical protein